MKMSFFENNREIVVYSICMGVALVAFRFLETRFFFLGYTTEFFVAGMALLFISIGILVARHFVKPKTIVVEKIISTHIPAVHDEKAIAAFGISKRELEVLELMAKGHSNGEIASELFVSLNTVKTHVSKLFEKLDVSRRTQAVEKAKSIGIIR